MAQGEGGGRPRIEITDKQWETIEAACKIQCTADEIGSLLGIHKDTIEARIKERFDISFSEYIKQHSHSGKSSLRRMQWKAAENGNTTMLIWLGKQYLGQSDKSESTVTTKELPSSVDEFV